MWWSREAPPCHITVIGLRHPLREPYVPLSEYTALLLLVQTKLTFLWIILRWQSLHTTSVFLCLAIIAISHRSLPFRLQATAEEKCYSKISEYLHRANYGLRNGNFEFNYGSGEIRYKIFVDFENRELSKDVVARSIFMPIFMFDRYGRGLIKLMLNEGNPEELIEDAEKDHPEEEERTESSSQ